MFLNDHILITKLHAPRVGVKLLGRPRLWEILKHYSSRKLILVTAPAGYGKTVLISQFTNSIPSPTTWYQLDLFDNDFALFVQHLLAGLERFLPGIVSDMLHLTQNNHNTPDETRRITAALVNSISDRLEGELYLAIDDYHVIREDKVHSFMEQLLYYLPENVHVFITSRSRPPINLERLRVAGLMEEIDLEELRFTREEIADFLINEKNGSVSSEIVTFLEEKTGGWPAALRLAAIAMTGSKRYKTEIRGTLPNQKEIYHYLATEVLRHMPGYLSEFVISTSVLEIMTPEICDHFMERDDSKRVLEELESRNLFVTAMKGEYQVYKYHPLFRDFLQNQLKEKQKTALLVRGGHSYLQSGYLSQAIECFLSAGDYLEALSVMEKAGSKMLLHNRWQTIKRWLEGIPANLKRTRPRIILLEGAICLNRGRLNEAEVFINEAASALTEASDREGDCQAKLIQARILRSRGKYGKSLKMLEQILPDLTRLPVAEWYDVTLEHSLILLMQGEFTKARNLLEPALSRAEHEGEMHIAAWLAERLGILYYFKGDYSRAVEVHEKAAEMAPQQDRLSFSLRDSMAAICHDWGDLDQALNYAQNSIKTKERLVLMEALPYSYSQLAFILASMNQQEAAEEKFLHSIALAKRMEGGKFFLALSMAFYSRFLADRGRLKEALTTGNEAVEISRSQSEFIYALCTEMAAAAYIKAGELREGTVMLQEALAILERTGARYFIFYAKAYLAALYRQQNNQAEAEKLSGNCLDLAGSENYLQFFLSHREMMLPVVRTGLIKGQEPEFIYEIIRRWGDSATDLLSELSRHDDSRVRERVIKAMALIKDKKIIKDLEKLLDDPHEKVRDRALAVLSAVQKVSEPKIPENGRKGDKSDLNHHFPRQEEPLKIQCLGPFQVFINNQEVTWRTNKARELFAYLFHYREKPVPKDKILEDLWPDSPPEKSSALFHTNLYQLRRVIKPSPGEQPVLHKDKNYYLNKRMLSSDMDTFKTLAVSPEEKTESQDTETSKLEQAVSLYRGEYMEDLDCHWVDAEREQLNQVYLSLLDRLAHRYVESGELDRAASCLRTILFYNPLLENTHALLMKIYARMGDRMAVMQQYQTLSRDLEQELGIKPATKTRDLYYKLCSEEE